MKSTLICAIMLTALTTLADTASAERLMNSDLEGLTPAEQSELIVPVIEQEFAVLENQVPNVVDRVIKIFDCETDNHRNGVIAHLDENDEPIRNYETGRAYGFAQLVPWPHERMAVRKGLDLNEVHDQIDYAIFLVQDRIRMGDHPLEDWRPCWS